MKKNLQYSKSTQNNITSSIGNSGFSYSSKYKKKGSRADDLHSTNKLEEQIQ